MKLGREPRISRGGGGKHLAHTFSEALLTQAAGVGKFVLRSGWVGVWYCAARHDLLRLLRAALISSAAPTGSGRPLQLQEELGLSQSGGGVYTTQNSAEPLGEGMEPGPRVQR